MSRPFLLKNNNSSSRPFKIDQTKIVIYETQAVVLAYLGKLLNACGFIVKGEVERTENLRNEIARVAPHVIVVSDADPKQALEVVREISDSTNSPIILCTLGTVPEEQSQLELMGVAAVVPRTETEIGGIIGAIHRCRA